MRYRDEENVNLCARNSESGEEARTTYSGRCGRGCWLSSSGAKQPELECGPATCKTAGLFRAPIFKIAKLVFNLNAISHYF